MRISLKKLEAARYGIYVAYTGRSGYLFRLAISPLLPGNWQNRQMDGNANLTETTLSKSLSILHMTLSHALEKGKTLKATETEAFLMDAAFSMAWLAGWIVPPESRWPPELQYILTPVAKKTYAENEVPQTVVLGGIEVPETFHDEFVSLFWQNQPDRTAKIAASINASVEAALSDPDFDPIEDLKASIARARRTEHHTVTPSVEPQPKKTNPALLLLAAKHELGVGSWDQLALMASKHLKELEAQQAKEGILITRTSGRVTRDDIFRLLKGKNIWLIKVKAIAILLTSKSVICPMRSEGWHWNDFIWPKQDHRKHGSRKPKSATKVRR